MSDDEVVCQGKELYAHLIEQGFYDFETYNKDTKDGIKDSSDNLLIEHASNYLLKSSLFSVNHTGLKNSRASPNDQFRLSTIMKSQLLFKEDIDIINSIISNHHISKNNSNIYWYVGLGCSTLLSSAVLFIKGINYYILPFSLTFTFSLFSCWEYLKAHCELNYSNALSSYIHTLQGLCSNTDKILHFLKETEFISTCQSSVHNGPALKQTSNEIYTNQLPSSIVLLNFRQCVLKSLFDIINSFLNANDKLKQYLPFWLSGICDESLREIVKSKTGMIEYDKCMNLKHIHLLNELYLLSQSEHLKLIALCISPDIWENSLDLKNRITKTVINHVLEMQCMFKNISFTLMMQFNFHSIINNANNRKITSKQLLRTRPRIANYLYLEVHNVFLLMMSLLSRVRSIQNDLDNFTDANELSNCIKTSLTKTLYELKNDFYYVKKYFDTLSKKNVIKSTDSNNVEGSSDTSTEYEATKTQIVVGSSDFNINSCDEVFLAMSGLVNQDSDYYDDNMFLEKKLFIPKDFMLELSNTLKCRKKDFNEREKIALIKKGLTHIGQDDSTSSDEDNTVFSSKLKKYKGKPQCKYNNIPDPDVTSFTSNTRSKYHSRVLLDGESSTDEDTFDNCNSRDKLTLFNSSLAEVIAMKSKSWGNTTEECFSDN